MEAVVDRLSTDSSCTRSPSVITALAALDARQRREIVALLGREAVLANLALVVDATSHRRRVGGCGRRGRADRDGPAPLFVLSAEPWPNERRCVGHHPDPATDAVRAAIAVAHRPRRAPELRQRRARLDHPAVRPGSGGDRGDRGRGRTAHRRHRSRDESSGTHAATRRGRPRRACASRFEPLYDWDDIVVSDDVREQLRELAGQVRAARPRLSSRGVSAPSSAAAAASPRCSPARAAPARRWPPRSWRATSTRPVPGRSRRRRRASTSAKRRRTFGACSTPPSPAARSCCSTRRTRCSASARRSATATIGTPTSRSTTSSSEWRTTRASRSWRRTASGPSIRRSSGGCGS